MTRHLWQARRVIDGAGGVIDHGAVLIDGTAIEAVGRSSEIGQPTEVEVVDLGDRTLLPGLIDVHNHVTFSGDGQVVQQVMAHDVDGMLAQGRMTAANLLSGGITTVRDLGGLGDAVFRLAAEIDAGQTVGPHIIASTVQLTSVGGPNAPLGGGCADLPAARDRIDADAEQGARVVKIIATGSITDTASDPTRPVFDDQTVSGIVEHAHRRGMRVAAHAHGTAGIVQAARCGVDTIEHASFLTHVETIDSGLSASSPGSAQATVTTWPDPDAVAVLVEHRPWIVPTITTAYAHTQGSRATPASLRDLSHRLAIGRTLLEHGLSFATGTDGGGIGCPNLSLIVEIEQFRQIGMSPMEAVVAATGHAAACLGLSDRGELRAGARADVIAVPGDPLQQLDLLRSPDLVIIGGRIAHRIEQRPLR